MKAVLLKQFGGPEVLYVGDAPKPEPGENQVRIRVMASTVNRADLHQREGNYPPPPGESEILGLEASGVVDAVGPGVEGWQSGDRVMSLLAGGGYAEYALAYAGHLLPVPDNLDFESAACVCETYITAFLNVFLIGELKDGQAVMLHGGGGGVNTAGIQLCRTLVPDSKIAVTASAGKVERVRQLGADWVIDYQNEDFAERIATFTADRGVDVILDHIGAAYLEKNLKSLAIGGRLVIIGLLGGAQAELNLGSMMVKRQRIIGSVIRARPVAEKADITAAFRDRVLPRLADGTIVPLIDSVFPMHAAADAHRTMAESRHFGKIVIRIGEA
jgi:putative PIG3 family NAD(P)H quinone oxidoreductase